MGGLSVQSSGTWSSFSTKFELYEKNYFLMRKWAYPIGFEQILVSLFPVYSNVAAFHSILSLFTFSFCLGTLVAWLLGRQSIYKSLEEVGNDRDHISA